MCDYRLRSIDAWLALTSMTVAAIATGRLSTTATTAATIWPPARKPALCPYRARGMLPHMPLPRRLRSFSLRTLMLLVAMAALAAWTGSYYWQRAEKDLNAAIAAIWRDNPRARILLHRRGDDCQIVARNIERVSPTAASWIARASLIRRIRLRAGSNDGLLGSIETDPDTVAILCGAFGKVSDGSFEVTCERPLIAWDPRKDDDFGEWDWPYWQHTDTLDHPLELRRPQER